jgi:hypothetical protein
MSARKADDFSGGSFTGQRTPKIFPRAIWPIVLDEKEAVPHVLKTPSPYLARTAYQIDSERFAAQGNREFTLVQVLRRSLYHALVNSACVGGREFHITIETKANKVSHPAQGLAREVPSCGSIWHQLRMLRYAVDFRNSNELIESPVRDWFAASFIVEARMRREEVIEPQDGWGHDMVFLVGEPPQPLPEYQESLPEIPCLPAIRALVHGLPPESRLGLYPESLGQFYATVSGEYGCNFRKIAREAKLRIESRGTVTMFRSFQRGALCV